jgi:ATP-binding cassette subfamily B protein
MKNGRIHKLFTYLSSKRKKELILLLMLMTLSALIELLSIASIVPFLGLLTSPEKILSNTYVRQVELILHVSEYHQILAFAAITFAFSSLISGFFRVLLLQMSTNLSFSIGSELGCQIYENSLYQSYEYHISCNSSEMVDAIVNKSNALIYGLILPTLNFISSTFMLVVTFGVLLRIELVATVGLLLGFSLAYLGIIKIFRRKLLKNSESVASESARTIKILQEGFGSIRDILIDGTQPLYCNVYKQSDSKMRRAAASNIIIGSTPKYILEAVGMALIALAAFYLTTENNHYMGAIPILGAIALGAQRMLPVIQQIYNSWASIASNRVAVDQALSMLLQPMSPRPKEGSLQPIAFHREIFFRGVGYKYEGSKNWIFRNATFSVKKGMKVGIVGKTGSGKSTLIDVLMGLLEPREGSLEIDGISINAKNRTAWQKRIAHVPQMIFLADTTVAENIAFGVPKEFIDMDRVRFAACQALLDDVIKTFPNGFYQTVGERGVQLSGGQRQRVAIARALYKQSDLLILDEATSALDGETEKSVMEVVNSLGANYTVFIIAHRMDTLENVDQLIKISSGEINFASEVGKEKF